MRRLSFGFAALILSFAWQMPARAAPAEIKTPAEARAHMQPWMAQCGEIEAYRARLQHCLSTPDDAVFDCFVELTSETGSEQAREQFNTALVEYQDGGSALKSALNGVQTLVRNVVADSPVPALNGTLDSFVPVLLPTLLQPFGDLEEPQTVGFSVTLPRLLWFKARAGGFVNPVPKINPALEGALVTRGGSVAGAPRQSDLDIGDDYYVTADVTVQGPWLGREPSFHGAALSRLARTAIAGRDLAGESMDSNQFLEVGTALRRTRYQGQDNETAAACAAEMYNRVSHQEWLRRSQAHLGEFWRFVHNQPQLIVSYRRLHRDDVVGASSTSYRARFSTGILNNVTWLKLLPGCTGDLGGDNCATLYERLLQWPTMTYGLGLSAYYEQGNLLDVNVALPPLPGGGLPLPLPSNPTGLEVTVSS